MFNFLYTNFFVFRQNVAFNIQLPLYIGKIYVLSGINHVLVI